MPEQHVALFKGLGLPEEAITAIEALTPDQMKAWKADDPESLKVFDPNKYTADIQTAMKTVLTNDATFLASIPEDKISKDILKKIESGQYARFQNEIHETAIKKLGLEDKVDLTDEDKKSIKGMVEKIATTYLTKKGGSAGAVEMQKKLSEALQSIETMKTENTENLKKELEKVNGANSAKMIRTLTRIELNDIPDVQLAVSAGVLTDSVLGELTSLYAVVLDGNDNLVLKQKAHPELDAIDDKGNKITLKPALKKIVLEKKLGTEVKVDSNDPNKKKIIVGSGEGGSGGDDIKIVPSYIAEKINANA